MIEYCRGNLLEADAEALVNPVNTQGVMGKGLALAIKNAFPEIFVPMRKPANAALVGWTGSWSNRELKMRLLTLLAPGY